MAGIGLAGLFVYYMIKKNPLNARLSRKENDDRKFINSYAIIIEYEDYV